MARKATTKAAPLIMPASSPMAPVDTAIVTPAQAAAEAQAPAMSPAAALKPYDTEDMRARATMAAAKHITLIESDERASIGTWVDLPPGLGDWRFVRCGRKNDPRAVAMRARLLRTGYVDAPPQVRLVGFEAEGSDGCYVCTPPETWERIQDVKRRLQKTTKHKVQQSFDAMLGQQLRGLDFEITGE